MAVNVAAHEEDEEGTLICRWDFETKAVGDSSDDGGHTGTVAELGNENKAMEYNVALQGNKGWEEAFATSFALLEAYTTPVNEKLSMRFDMYFPEDEAGSVSDFGTMKAQLVLNNGDNWDWLAADTYPEITASKLESCEIEGYSKIRIAADITGNKEENGSWEMSALTALKAVTIKLVGDTSAYNGKLYIDNVVLRDTSAKTEESGPNPPVEEEPEGELIYKNNFDELTDLDGVLYGADTSGAILETLAEGNKAVKYTASLTGEEWTNIFQAQFNLPTAYSKAITEKVVMSYDVYFPTAQIGDNFDSMKAQAVLKSGADWTWTAAKAIPAFQSTDLTEDEAVPNYKKLHVKIDMTDFEAGGETCSIEDITPIQAVLPCLAGAGSSYTGDVCLDNLEVRAVNKTGKMSLRRMKRNGSIGMTLTHWKILRVFYRRT